ncbi:MAG: hypothetical protein JXR23_09710 [Pontiellaceae bacterium]|nr:hypothetical protein [Pontiellaceae bacterium]
MNVPDLQKVTKQRKDLDPNFVLFVFFCSMIPAFCGAFGESVLPFAEGTAWVVAPDFNQPFADAQELASGQNVIFERPKLQEPKPEYAAPQQNAPMQRSRGDMCVVY